MLRSVKFYCQSGVIVKALV